jgi:hypothetical protein
VREVVGVRATLVPPKAKMRKRTVPTNSPIMAIKSALLASPLRDLAMYSTNPYDHR